MSVEILSQEEVKKLIVKFLSKCGYRYAEDDLYFGELLTAANQAIIKFDPSKGNQISTLIWEYCRRQFLKLKREEGRFYEKHKFCYPMENFTSKERNPYDNSILEEAKAILAKSGLTERCREVIMTRLEYPSDSLKKIGERLGISHNAVHLHMNSAKQYFARNNISLMV